MGQRVWRLAAGFLCIASFGKGQDTDLDLTPYVNPFIGTGQGAPEFGMGSAAGNTPPGAAYPFGMLLWSPDTTSESGGYRYEQKSINGFSVTHFSGRGIACWQDLPFMPAPGTVNTSPGSDWNAYASSFSHAGDGLDSENERASPGYYGVRLNSGVGVELTVTRRTGFARFKFPAAANGTVLVNAAGSANGNWGKTWVRVGGDRLLYGAITSGNCGGEFSYTLYFAVLFDQPSVASGVWNGATLSPADVADVGTGGYLTFDTASNSVVQAKIGLSFVSFTNAYGNLLEESPAWDFETVRQSAAAAWNRRLNAIQLGNGPDTSKAVDENLKTVFYTALYHASIHPSTFSDVNGEYLGFDGAVHHTDRTQYHNIPSWDFYRSLVPLLAITAPEVASDLVQSLVNDAQQDPGGGMPRWVHAAVDSCGMFGDGSSKVAAAAFAFGARDFDVQAALAAMIRGASQPGTTSSGCPVREGIQDYLRLGYVSTSTWGSVSRTLEYAASDFSISQLANAIGDGANYKTFLRRAQNWRNLLRGQYLVPRDAAGNFAPEFAPDGCVTDGYIEGSGGQYGFMVRFNARGLFSAFGGSAGAIARLDRHFQELNAGPCSEFAFMGNEPSLMTPWMYSFAGAPWKTQQTVRRILLDLYSNSPGGMPGNDDGGVLSSWVVFAAIGLYPEIPGVGGFVVGTPLFPQITMRLRGGRDLRITASQASSTMLYLQRLTLNDGDFSSPWLPWSAISNGGVLEFTLADKPNRDWGSKADAAPPSYDAPDKP